MSTLLISRATDNQPEVGDKLKVRVENLATSSPGVMIQIMVPERVQSAHCQVQSRSDFMKLLVSMRKFTKLRLLSSTCDLK